MKFRNVVSAVFGTVTADEFRLVDPDTGDDVAILTSTPPDPYRSALDLVDAALPGGLTRMSWAGTVDVQPNSFATTIETTDDSMPFMKAGHEQFVRHVPFSVDTAVSRIRATDNESDGYTATAEAASTNGSTQDGRAQLTVFGPGVRSATIGASATNNGSQSNLVATDTTTAGVKQASVTAKVDPAGSTGDVLIVCDRMGPWQFPAFAPNVGDYGAGFGAVRYRRMGDWVELAGLLLFTGFVEVGSPLWTFSVGYRPILGEAMPTFTNPAGGVATILRLEPSGVISDSARAHNVGEYIALTGLRFPVS